MPRDHGSPSSPGLVPDMPAQLRQLGFQEIRRDGNVVLVPPLAKVPEGPFLMGADGDTDKLAHAAREPRHEVKLSGFQIAKTPVTVAEWTYALAAKANGVTPPPYWSTQQTRPDHPVVAVSLEQINLYITWLQTMTEDNSWRLPTEAE